MKPEDLYLDLALRADYNLTKTLIYGAIRTALAKDKKMSACKAAYTRVVVKNTRRSCISPEGLPSVLFVASVTIRNQSWGYAEVYWSRKQAEGKIKLHDVGPLTPRLRRLVQSTWTIF